MSKTERPSAEELKYTREAYQVYPSDHSVHILFAEIDALNAEVAALRSDSALTKHILEQAKENTARADEYQMEMDARVLSLLRENKRLREVLKDAKPIYAISSNTASVRKGYEMGGYVKHYVIEPHVMNEALGRNR